MAELALMREEVLQREELLDVLYAFAPQVHSSGELTDILQAVSESVQTILHGDWCALLTLQEGRHHLGGLSGEPPETQAAKLEAGQLPLEEGEQPTAPSFLTDDQRQPLLLVPMELRGARLGWILVGYPQGTEQLDSRTRDLAASIARQAAIALGNAQMALQLQEQQAALERRTAEVAAANKELEAFSYSVSHDLRAPLRSIDGFSQALLEDYGEKLDEQGQDHLHRVRRASQRMGELIDDLLSLSRVTRAELVRGRVDLSGLARTIAGELRQRQPERQVEFVIADGVEANGDARLLRVALENLMGNAWKYSGKHPQARIEVGVTEQEGKRVYYVRDDGAGFDMAYADRLFGTFQRLHSPGEFEGTGIGLATVQRIIHRHGGRIWAEGAAERGATFYFTVT